MEKLKSKVKLIEIVFYVSFTIYCILKNLGLHFVSKDVGAYLYLSFGLIVLVYVRYVHMLPDSKKKNWILVFAPIAVLVSRNYVVMLGLMLLSFSVFGRYDRTTRNRIMKSIYAVFMFCSIFILAYTAIVYKSYAEKDEGYVHYALSDNKEYVVTVLNTGEFNKLPAISYSLENVYFGFLKKHDHEIVVLRITEFYEVTWISESEVEFGGKVYNIYD